jgi:hypothetical protein
MGKRRRATCSFKPQADHLERLAGASSLLAVGALADAAFALSVASAVDQPAAPTAQSPDSEGGEFSQVHRSPSSPTSTIGASHAAVLGPRVDPVAVSDGVGLPSPTIPAPPPTAGFIRPLALAPSPQPTSIPVPPPISQLLALGNAVGNGITGASLPPAQSATPSIVQPVPVAAASSQPVPVAAASSGNPAPTGYIATGGGSSGPVQFAAGNFAGGGGSGMTSGTSTNSGAGTVSSTNQGSSAGSNPGATTSSPGTYTIPGRQNQGGGPPAKGELEIKPSGGSPFIGSAATFNIVTSNGASATNTSWSVSGNAYSGNTFNTAYGNMAWVHPTFVPPAPSDNATQISFAWGEKPGTYTVSVTATVGTDAGVKAQRTVAVRSPQWDGQVSWWPNTEIFANSVLRYRHYIKAEGKSDAGIDWTFSSANGTFAVEQLVTAAIWSESSPAKNITGPKNAQGTSAPFPLVDSPSVDNLPWYSAPPNLNAGNDSPNLPGFQNLANATTATFSESFTDYALFMPSTGGIYVPLVQFSWGVNATATNTAGQWTDKDNSPAGETSKLQKNSGWPQVAVDGPANKYNTMS